MFMNNYATVSGALIAPTIFTRQTAIPTNQQPAVSQGR
jgi:hypothetical protein